MTNQSGFPSTLQPAQPKREARRDQILGGAVGFIDETLGETFKYITGDYPIVNEGPVRGQSLEELNKLPEMVREELTGFQTPRSKLDINPEIAINKIKQEILAEHNQAKMEPQIEQKREEVNKRLGFNENYRVPVNEDGNYSGEYYKVEDEKKNSQLTEAELKANREKQVVQAIGKATPAFQMRQGELDMKAERTAGGHFTSNIG